MPVSLKKNPIDSLVSSITSRVNHAPSSSSLDDASSSSSYLLLLQHSLQSPRQVLWHDDNSSKDVYRRAGVRTPLENSMRDASGHVWLRYIVDAFAKHQNTGLLWVSTSATTDEDIVDAFRTKQDTVVINVVSDVWGMEMSERDESVVRATLEDLETLAVTIERHALQLCTEKQRPVVLVVIESLSPIIMRHGWHRTLQWIRRLCSTLQGPIFIPVLVECLSPLQHQALEDTAQAVLDLHHGEMNLIRQGVRESGNTIRDDVPFQLLVDDSTGTFRIEVGKQPDTQTSSQLDPVMADQATEKSAVRLPSHPKEESPVPSLDHGRAGKVKLKLEEDGEASAPRTASAPGSGQRPRIFLQDDDPEFADHDEEDPDDDLDI